MLRGWRFVEDDPDYEPYWEDPNGNMIGVDCKDRFPNCAGCLNAMHDAEKMLTDSQWGVYVNYLTAKTKRDYRRACAEATARQRAEAFLRTLGKWEEEA